VKAKGKHFLKSFSEFVPSSAVNIVKPETNKSVTFNQPLKGTPNGIKKMCTSGN
jgi:hypothetical protein